MKTISILVSQDFLPGSIVGPMEMFQLVNGYFRERDPLAPPFFQVELVGLEKGTINFGPVSFHCEVSIEEANPDLILIPAILGDIMSGLERNKSFVPWILHQRLTRQTEIMSVCMGAFMLASTGLLEGKSATTHWTGIELFRELFPGVNLEPDTIITDQEGIYTSGGATTYMNLVLYLIDKYCGKEVAIWASKLLLIDFDKVNQNYFAIFSTQKRHRDNEIKQAQTIIEERYAQQISVETLARQVSVSKRSFIRRFKQATHNTPLEYIQRVKVEAAKKALESSKNSVTRIMYDVGYQDVKSFRTVFKRITGLTPLEYRRKYSRALVS